MNQYLDFEKQIHWLHELIERNRSIVKWNDRIVDPDNPDRSRQIDVLIKTARSRVIVECRFRSRPQDVTWIEELIGRRASLEVDGVIAVSSSGFTEGAIAKARKFGIVLRDFSRLSPEEIQSWGGAKRIVARFVRYKTVVVDAVVARGCAVDPKLLSNNQGFSKAIYFALVKASAQVSAQLPMGRSTDFHMRLNSGECNFGGFPLLYVRITGSAELFEQRIQVLSVKGYGAPWESHGEREVVIEEFDAKGTRIAQREDQVSIVFDMSSIQSPENCLFQGFSGDMGEIVSGRIECIGVEGMQPPKLSFTLNLREIRG